MKKSLRIGSVAIVGIILLASCKKDYTCECAEAIVNGGVPVSVTVSTSNIKATEKNATEQCGAMASVIVNGTYVHTTSCAIVE